MPRRFSFAFLLMVAAMLFGAADGAQAHAILVDSTPAIGGIVPAGKIAFTLRFNSRIDQGRSRLTLTGPGKAGAVLAVSADPRPDIMAATAELGSGGYTLRWQVLAIDGHITRGDVPFTVSAKP